MEKQVRKRASLKVAFCTATVLTVMTAYVCWSQVQAKLARRKSYTFSIDSEHRNIIRFPTRVPRIAIAELVEHLGLRIGAEVGVQRGYFAAETLQIWNSCQKYVLVDLWAHQENYLDKANKNQTIQEEIMKDAMKNVDHWEGKIETCRNFSEVCAHQYPDNYFDYVYIDARHDFKGVYADLQAWYPKIKSDGIMAGHDYMSAVEVARQDWTVQFDGTFDYGRQAVRGAVNLFVAENEQYVTFPDWPKKYRSWVIRKTAGQRKSNNILHFINLSCFEYEEREDCRLVPKDYAKMVMHWERKNLDSISILWTPALVRRFFPHLSVLFYTAYNRNVYNFEEVIKLEVLYKFGGIFISAENIPIIGIRQYIESLSTGKVVAACRQKSSGKEFRSTGNRCQKLSPLLLGSEKGNEALKILSRTHRSIFSLGFRSLNAYSGLLPELIKNVSHIVVDPDVTLPCTIEEYSENCVALDGFSLT